MDEIPLDTEDHLVEERQLLDEHIVVFRFDGPLFFAAAHTFLLDLSEMSDVRVVVLRMSRGHNAVVQHPRGTRTEPAGCLIPSRPGNGRTGTAYRAPAPKEEQ